MDRLPIEILHNIFIKVSFEERQECTLVCRSWYNVLSRHSLLYDIDIKSDQTFNAFIKMLQNLPSRALQVEILNLTSSATLDKRVICNMLPNLRICKIHNQRTWGQQQDHCSKPLELTYLNSKLESIWDTEQCELTRQLLKFGSCPRLKYLFLSQKFENPRNEIFIHLKSAPVLTKIFLREGNIGIGDLEIIHKNVPSLETLMFDFAQVIPSELPDNIIPATTVTKFKVALDERNPIGYPTCLNWYTYLARKYINLEHFNFYDTELSNLNSSQKMAVYRDGIFPIYKKTGKTLAYFDVNDFTTQFDPFFIMDEFGVRVSVINLKDNETRPLFEKIAISNQPKYVEILNISNTAIASPIMLQNFTSLREINIDITERFPHWNVNLTDYFNAFPETLTKFAGHFCDAKINGLPTHPTNIQHLELKCTTLYPQLGEAISNFFPKLDNLTLRGQVKNDMSINLPNNHFKTLDIEVDFIDYPEHGFFTSETNAFRPRYYIVKGKRKSTQSSTAKELQNRIMISIYFASAKYLRCDKLKIGSP